MINKYTNKQRGLLAVIMAMVMVFAGAAFVAAEVDAETADYTDVSTAEEARNALNKGENIRFLNDIVVEAISLEGAKVGLKQTNGIIDGNGKTLTVNGANSTYDCAIKTEGGTIKNLTINGANRGIYSTVMNSDLNVINCVLDKVTYTFNYNSSNTGKNVYFENTKINGWTSHAACESVKYYKCEFGKDTGTAGYSQIRPYSGSIFDQCVFSEDMVFDNSLAQSIFKGCTFGNDLQDKFFGYQYPEMTNYNIEARATVDEGYVYCTTVSEAMEISSEVYIFGDISTMEIDPGVELILSSESTINDSSTITLNAGSKVIASEAPKTLTITGPNSSTIVLKNINGGFEVTGGSVIFNGNNVSGSVEVNGGNATISGSVDGTFEIIKTSDANVILKDLTINSGSTLT